MSEKAMPENVNWRKDVDPNNLDLDRLKNAHILRQTNAPGVSDQSVLADIIEDDVFRKARNKSLKSRDAETSN